MKIIAAAAFLAAAISGGCCKTCPAPRTMTVEAPCALPALPVLAPVETAPCGSTGGLVACFDVVGAAGLAARLSAQREWIEQATARCGVPPTIH